ncbi:gliding motility-associated-like protein [Thermonema lapsum]|uniref:Gliding motility-associated-like protein n=1 Tax=Thermonema lapsum TaxID=28195 RepID=A0A846MSC0_9BACT|nr:gliding motility-associated C-terminal domain-containing protein [Thermonema lapsum]NIK74486.1 gliding motility-associated-like protein [Thermonema lapsum]
MAVSTYYLVQYEADIQAMEFNMQSFVSLFRLRHCLLFCAIGLWTSVWESKSAQAQSPCFYAKDYPAGATRIRACAPFSIELIDCTGGGQNIAYRFQEGGVRTPSNTFTYTTPGIYSITQYGNFPDSNGGFIGDSLTKSNYVEVLAVPVPPIRMERCNGRRLRITAAATPYEQYVVNWGDGSPLQMLLPGSSLTHVYATAGNYTPIVRGEYILNRTDGQNCGKDTTFTLSIYEDISNLNFNFQMQVQSPLSVCKGQVLLSWQGLHADWQYDLEVSRNNGAYEPVLHIENSTATSVEYVWQGNTLTQSLRFRLTVRNACGESVSFVSATYSPPLTQLPVKVRNLQLSFTNDNRLQANWRNDESVYAELQELELWQNGQATNNLPNSGTFTSQAPLTAAVCWQLRKNSDCGTIALSDYICPLWLEVNPQGQNAYRLSWRPYRRNDTVISQTYEIVVSDEAGNVLERFAAGSVLQSDFSPADTQQQLLYVHIESVLPSGFVSRSNRQRIERPLQLHFPTAFTPNGDGLNDTFHPKGAFVRRYRLQIYDSKGSLLFESSNIEQGWDGAQAPPGSYLYHATAEDYLGRTYHFQGVLTLIR